jgi:hypothetical protein
MGLVCARYLLSEGSAVMRIVVGAARAGSCVVVVVVIEACCCCDVSMDFWPPDLDALVAC